MKITSRLSYWLFLSFLVLCAGCGNDEQPKPLPSLEAVRPESAAVGATVVLVGSDFSTDPSKNTVTFSGVPGTVEQATETELVVRVPAGAYLPERPYAEVLVVTEGRASSRGIILKSDFYPDVFSITPQTARVGEIVTINGQNLNLDPEQTTLLFNWMSAQSNQVVQTTPTASTGTTLRVRVPAGAASGKVAVFLYIGTAKDQYISRLLPIIIIS